MGAIEKLAELQLRYYNTQHGADNLEYIENIRQRKKDIPDFRQLFKSGDLFDSALEKMQDSAKSMPTKYQDELYYNYLKQSFIDLDEIINSNKISFKGVDIVSKPIPVFGTINLNTYNAHIRADENEPLIVFNEGLLKLTRDISSLITARIIYGIEDKHLDEDIIRHYIDLMLCHHFYNDSEEGAVWEFDNIDIVDIDFYQMHEDIFNSTLMFIVGHEYAHLLLKHIEISYTKSSSVHGLSIETYNYRWQQEFDADSLGVQLSLKNKRITSSSPHFGSLLALRILHLSRISNSKLSKTHPPICKRIESAKSYIKSVLENCESIDLYMPDMLIEPMQIQYKAFVEKMISEGVALGQIPIGSIREKIYKDFCIVDRGSSFHD